MSKFFSSIKDTIKDSVNNPLLNEKGKLPFLEVIESFTSDPDLLMWKYEDDGLEIKNGAALTVRESQSVLFLHQGELGDVFGPGMHKLSTKNIPILTSLKSWKYGLESPFKCDIYFFNTRQFVNLKWGTPAPILLPDAQFGQVRVRAFGAYNIRIADGAKFFRQYAGTASQVLLSELQGKMRDFVAPAFSEALAQLGCKVVDVASNISALGNTVLPQLQPLFADLGLELLKFQITSVTLPEEVTKYYDTATSMNMLGDMERYKQFNIANAMGQAGQGGSSFGGALQDGAAMGIMMGTMQQMQQQQQQQQMQQPQQAAPANQTPPPADDLTAKLTKLKSLFEAGLLNEAEYNNKKAELLSQL